MKSNIYFLHCLSPLHVGGSDEGHYIDMPVVREKATNLPYVPGSSLKGVWRQQMRSAAYPDSKKIEAVFGPDSANADTHAGALSIGDGMLLCLPVRSYFGGFAWVTTPFQLERYRRDYLHFRGPREVAPALIAIDSIAACKLPAENASQLLSSAVATAILLEDVDLTVSACPAALVWAKHIAEKVFPFNLEWQALFKERFAVVSETMFAFLCDTATEVRTRVAMDPDVKVVKQGGLWTEESIPSEAIFCGGIAIEEASFAKDHKERVTLDLGNFEMATRLQVGGNATIGQGQVNWICAKGANGN
jgi:CRISPR-associated protein Cmr4